MLLSELFVSTAILEGGTHATKESIIGELLLRLAADGHLATADVPAVHAELMRRERIDSTGIGSGVAMPYARCEVVAGPLGILAVCRAPVHFDSIDGEPADIFALLLLPSPLPGSPTPRHSYRLMRALADKRFCAGVRRAKSEAEIFDLLRAAGGSR